MISSVLYIRTTWKCLARYRWHDNTLQIWWVMRNSLNLTACSVFFRPVFYRLGRKIVNLWDSNLKSLESIFDINIDNPTKYWKATLSRSCISLKTGYLSLFEIWWALIQRPDESCKFLFGFRASQRGLISGSNFILIYPVVS